MKKLFVFIGLIGISLCGLSVGTSAFYIDSDLEARGVAAPITSYDGYQQYVNYYGTDKAFFLGQEYFGMIGLTYSLYGISQSVNVAGNALRGVVQARGNLRTAISRNNLLSRKVDLGNEQQGFKSFPAFKRAMGPAGEGQAWHHIVEQHAGNKAKFTPEQLHNTKNIIRLPHGAGSIHAKISGFYSSIRPEITSSPTLTVRQWLGTQTYQQQYDFGMQT